MFEWSAAATHYVALQLHPWNKLILMKLGDLLGGIKKEQSKEEPSKDMTKSMIKTPSVVEAADKPLFNNLRKLINIMDSFRDIALQEHISLPKIAVCGKIGF